MQKSLNTSFTAILFLKYVRHLRNSIQNCTVMCIPGENKLPVIRVNYDSVLCQQKPLFPCKIKKQPYKIYVLCHKTVMSVHAFWYPFKVKSRVAPKTLSPNCPICTMSLLTSSGLFSYQHLLSGIFCTFN